MSVDLSLMAAGGCIVLWFTGYAFGHLVKFVHRVYFKASR